MKTLVGLLQDARSTVRDRHSAKALRQRSAIAAELKRLEALGRAPWEGLEPVDRFLVFEVSDAARAAAPVAVRADAYTSALRVLPADWWGAPLEPLTDAGEHLVALGRDASPRLAGLLDARETLAYQNSESRELVVEHGLTLGDLAADLLARTLGQRYVWDAPAEQRAAARRTLGGAVAP